MTTEQKLARELKEIGMDAWQFHEAAVEIGMVASLAHRVTCGAASPADKLELAGAMARIRQPPAPDARCVENMR